MSTQKKLGLAIDLDTCVGCHACAVACKEWNGESLMTGGVPDYDPYGKAPSGAWFNRIRHYEISGDPKYSPKGCASSPHPNPLPEGEGALYGGHIPLSKTVNVPMSCMHCEEADCVTVCPTGASYKRAEDGIVLVDPAKCMGCNYCAWACPYGARELDENQGVMKKCTLCVDRIYDQALPEAERQPACVLACPTQARHFGDFADPQSNVSQMVAKRGKQEMFPALGYQPVNAYLSMRAPAAVAVADAKPGLRSRLAQLVNKVASL
jgi:sulfite dehydrogenase (quinone) subunit SoeB